MFCFEGVSFKFCPSHQNLVLKIVMNVFVKTSNYNNKAAFKI